MKARWEALHRAFAVLSNSDLRDVYDSEQKAAEQRSPSRQPRARKPPAHPLSQTTTLAAASLPSALPELPSSLIGERRPSSAPSLPNDGMNQPIRESFSEKLATLHQILDKTTTLREHLDLFHRSHFYTVFLSLLAKIPLRLVITPPPGGFGPPRSLDRTASNRIHDLSLQFCIWHREVWDGDRPRWHLSEEFLQSDLCQAVLRRFDTMVDLLNSITHGLLKCRNRGGMCASPSPCPSGLIFRSGYRLTFRRNPSSGNFSNIATLADRIGSTNRFLLSLTAIIKQYQPADPDSDRDKFKKYLMSLKETTHKDDSGNTDKQNKNKSSSLAAKAGSRSKQVQREALWKKDNGAETSSAPTPKTGKEAPEERRTKPSSYSSSRSKLSVHKEMIKDIDQLISLLWSETTPRQDDTQELEMQVMESGKRMQGPGHPYTLLGRHGQAGSVRQSDGGVPALWMAQPKGAFKPPETPTSRAKRIVGASKPQTLKAGRAQGGHGTSSAPSSTGQSRQDSRNIGVIRETGPLSSGRGQQQGPQRDLVRQQAVSAPPASEIQLTQLQTGQPRWCTGEGQQAVPPRVAKVAYRNSSIFTSQSIEVSRHTQGAVLQQKYRQSCSNLSSTKALYKYTTQRRLLWRIQSKSTNQRPWIILTSHNRANNGANTPSDSMIENGRGWCSFSG